MIVSVHQPNFLPWLGYFDKILLSDTFVILDNVQFPRGKSVANRNKIKTANGILDIVVPLSKPKGNNGIVGYKEVFFSDKNWQLKVLKTLSFSYSKSPYYDIIFPFIEDVLYLDSFVNMNITFISRLLDKFKIDTKIVLLSDLNTGLLRNNELILEICNKVGADEYLSGVGAKKYNDDLLYQDRGIKLTYQNYIHPQYNQTSMPFDAYLSIVDALFNLGFDGTSSLLKKRDKMTQ